MDRVGRLPAIIIINSQPWTVIESRRRPRIYADCDYDRKLIRIERGLPRDKLLIILLHEIAHVILPRASEKRIIKIGQDLAAAVEAIL